MKFFKKRTEAEEPVFSTVYANPEMQPTPMAPVYASPSRMADDSEMRTVYAAPVYQPEPVHSDCGLEVPGGYLFNLSAFQSVSIGRDRSNTIMLSQIHIARQHLSLQAVSGKWLAVDHGSANGTLLNGSRLTPGTPAPLSDGDILTLPDNVQFRFRSFSSEPQGYPMNLAY